MIPVVEELPTQPRVFRNETDETLRSRNPRFEVKPGESVLLDVATINHSARNWIRRGELVDVDLVPA